LEYSCGINYSQQREVSKMMKNRYLASSLAVVLLSGVWFTSQNLQSAQAQVQLRGNITRTMRQANRQFQLGKWEEAEKIYTQSVKKAPNNSLNQANLGIVQAELFKLDAAEKSAEKALQLNPKNAYAHIALGIAYRNRTSSSDMTHRNRRDELLNQSLEEFKTAIRLDSANPDAYNGLGEVYRMQGQLEKAEEAFSKAVELDSEYSEAVANRGTVLSAQGNIDEAIETFKEAIKLNSKNYKAHYYLGDALAKKGRYHDAYNALNTALYQNRNSEIVYTKMGDVLSAQGNESAAISKYREAIRIKPEYTPAYQQLAKLFDNRGDGEFAISELKSALNANPKLSELKVDLGRLSLSVDKPEDALRFYQEALSDNPNNPEALKGLAQTYVKTAENSSGQGILGGSDKYVDAEIAIGRALQINPDDLSLRLAMIKISQLSGKPALANEQLQYIVNQPVRTSAQKLTKAEALYTLGRYGESDQLFRDILGENVGNLQQQLVVADILKVEGNLDMAQEAYQQVLLSQPANLKAQRGLQRIELVKTDASKKYNLAVALNSRFSKQKRGTAKDFYLESVSIYPRQPEARLALAKIYNQEDDYGKAIFEYESYLNLNPELNERERQRIQSTVTRLKEKLAALPSQPVTASSTPLDQSPNYNLQNLSNEPSRYEAKSVQSSNNR